MLVVTLKFVSFHALANMFQPPNLEQNVAAASHDRVPGSLVCASGNNFAPRHVMQGSRAAWASG